jgi:hypothetical protein
VRRWLLSVQSYWRLMSRVSLLLLALEFQRFCPWPGLARES